MAWLTKPLEYGSGFGIDFQRVGVSVLQQADGAELTFADSNVG